jgi:hypothetical protein
MRPLAPSEMEHAGSRVVRKARRSYNPFGAALFGYALARFRATIGSMA